MARGILVLEFQVILLYRLKSVFVTVLSFLHLRNKDTGLENRIRSLLESIKKNSQIF